MRIRDWDETGMWILICMRDVALLELSRMVFSFIHELISHAGMYMRRR